MSALLYRNVIFTPDIARPENRVEGKVVDISDTRIEIQTKDGVQNYALTPSSLICSAATGRT